MRTRTSKSGSPAMRPRREAVRYLPPEGFAQDREDGEFSERLSRTLTLMTYNIHSGIGEDGRYDLERIERVIRAVNPDVVALQEVDRGLGRSGHEDQPRVLAERLGMAYSHCVTEPCERGGFGNAVLSRFPLRAPRPHDISPPRGRERRYCLQVDLDLGEGEVLHVFNCHLGLAVRERIWQQRQMLSEAILLSRDLEHPVALLGDFNDWPLQVVHQKLRLYFREAFNTTGRRDGATFRLGWLRFRLDHIYLSPEVHVLQSWVQRKPPADLASDHRPLVARVELAWRPQRTVSIAHPPQSPARGTP